jgi:hypothetical protein
MVEAISFSMMMTPIIGRSKPMQNQNDLLDAGIPPVKPDPNVGNGAILVDFLREHRIIYGGPYRHRPSHLPGIKLAREIAEPCDVDCPIADFSIPDYRDALRGVYEALRLLSRHEAIYLGCMGGWGRTGLFMALLVKSCRDFRFHDSGRIGQDLVERLNDPSSEVNPVSLVRRDYSPRAIETKAQEWFVHQFPTRLYPSVWNLM